MAIDGTMVYIREEILKELKVDCVFDIAPLHRYDPHTKEEIELGSATHKSYVDNLDDPVVFSRKHYTDAPSLFDVF
ncbi:MAG: hypothetical protein IBX69_16440 [Anaerolineales bacterium]|nr:hypothetical protein [Anaerolineales bacterium]